MRNSRTRADVTMYVAGTLAIIAMSAAIAFVVLALLPAQCGLPSSQNSSVQKMSIPLGMPLFHVFATYVSDAQLFAGYRRWVAGFGKQLWTRKGEGSTSKREVLGTDRGAFLNFHERSNASLKIVEQ